MKLIRLSSETSGDFQNVFNDDIIIPKNSSIGLVSASVPLSNKVITIDTTNNLFEMRTQASDSGTPRAMYDVDLVIGSYTEPSFLLEMTRALNAALDNDIEKTACCQWKTSLKQKFLELELRRGSYDVDVVHSTTPADNDFSHYQNLTYSIATNSYEKSSVGENWDAYGITKAFTTGGAGQQDFSVDLATTKFALGLISEPPAVGAATLTLADYDYAIYTDSTQANYQVAWNKGANTEVTTLAQVDDSQIIIELSEGSLNLIHYNKDTTAFTTLKSFPNWTFQTSFHLAFNVRSVAANGVVSNVQMTPDPFGDTLDGVYIYPSVHKNVVHDPSALTTPGTGAIASIAFKQKPRTGTYCGFHESEYTMPNQQTTWDLYADEELTEAVSFTDLLVEIPSLTMESYDGAMKKRRPVIAYIPSLEVQNSELVYNSVNPIMISLNNAFPINLNSISVRILTSSPQEVTIESASIVVVMG